MSSSKKTILLLEDDEDRIQAFRRAVGKLGPDYQLRLWLDAPQMMAEGAEAFPDALLIALDHDLNPQPGARNDPGTGLDVARFLGDFLPVCPVLIHSSNTDRVWSMHNELRFAGWIVDRVGPLGTDWIESTWLTHARRLLEAHGNTWTAALPKDHDARVARVRTSLDGLGLGDALGEMCSYRAHEAPRRLADGELPGGPWIHTDDTEMAIALAGVLKAHGGVHQDALAKRFARRFEREPDRGYGRMTRLQLRDILGGANWRETSRNAFGGQGSMGNGSAMRVAPVGAYFADDLERVADEARASSVVTHTHREAVAGAIAVAVGAALSWRLRGTPPEERAEWFFGETLRLTPPGDVRQGILQASQMPKELPERSVAEVLGCGELVTATDTVPFCLWVAAHHAARFADALVRAIQVGGDCDTNAAIVGGMVALAVGAEGLPAAWLNAREAVHLG